MMPSLIVFLFNWFSVVRSKLDIVSNISLIICFYMFVNNYLCNEFLCKLGFSNCPRDKIKTRA
jgi:hypothetical protein